MIDRFTMRKILALVRAGDFIHPGEIEAIHLTLDRFSKKQACKILDVGSGFGGTAAYIQKNNWGQVVGIDIDQEHLDYAKSKYIEIDFYLCDVIDIKKLNQLFDLFCLFNSFYAFPDQEKALLAMREVSNKNAKLVIFDYVEYSPIRIERVPYPIKLSEFITHAEKTRWRILEIKNIDHEYLVWYSWLEQALLEKRKSIVDQFGQQAFNDVYQLFYDLLERIRQKKLGGAIIYATAK